MKIATSPVPTRENYQVLPLDQVSSEYERVVFDKAGNSYRTDFLSEDQKEQEIDELSYIQANLVYEERIPETESIANTQANLVFDERTPEIVEIANEAVLEAQLPLPALWSESSAASIIGDPFNDWDVERYNPDNIVTKISATTFELTPGYVYKISGMLTCQSTSEDFTGVEWRLRGTKSSLTTGTITFFPNGNTGILYQEDESGDAFQNYSITSSINSTHFMTADIGFVTRCNMDIVYKAPGTVLTHGDSKILFEVIKKI